MGFFQDLKEDLSQAVGELLPEEGTGVAFDDTQEDTGVDAALKEVEEALAAELGERGERRIHARPHVPYRHKIR